MCTISVLSLCAPSQHCPCLHHLSTVPACTISVLSLCAPSQRCPCMHHLSAVPACTISALSLRAPSRCCPCMHHLSAVPACTISAQPTLALNSSDLGVRAVYVPRPCTHPPLCNHPQLTECCPKPEKKTKAIKL